MAPKGVSLIEEAKYNNENLETYLNEIVRKHNFICFVIIKIRANGLWANNLQECPLKNYAEKYVHLVNSVTAQIIFIME